jgi:hypothetical protein
MNVKPKRPRIYLMHIFLNRINSRNALFLSQCKQSGLLIFQTVLCKERVVDRFEL